MDLLLTGEEAMLFLRFVELQRFSQVLLSKNVNRVFITENHDHKDIEAFTLHHGKKIYIQNQRQSKKNNR